MKKLLMSLVVASAFLLSACGGDGGEMAGSFKGKVEGAGIFAGEYETADITFNPDKNEYHVTWMNHSPKHSPQQGAYSYYLTRENGWLITSDGAKYFKITDVNTIEFKGNKAKTYKRITKN